MSYTYVVMDVSPETYREIRLKMLKAQYQHALHRTYGKEEVIDMHGLALRALPVKVLRAKRGTT